MMWTGAACWKGPIPARMCVAYFAAMETLQAFQYSYVGLCDDPVNKVLTILGFVHLAFQPLFVNLYLGCFMNNAQKKYLPLILGLCLFAGVMMSNRMVFTLGDIPCQYKVEPMCGLTTCTFRGDVHLAWQMPLQHSDQDYFTPGFTLHFFMFYLPTFALGMYEYTIFLLLSGPFLGRALTSHNDEIPAIWCFFSIVQVIFPYVHARLTARRISDQLATADDSQDKQDEASIGGLGKMVGRAIVLGLFLTLKRYGTMLLAMQREAAAASPAAVH